MRIAVLHLALAIAAVAQPKPGPQVLRYLSTVDGTDQPYALYLPPGYSPETRYPLVLSLHGAGSDHRLNLRRVFGFANRPGEGDADATRYWPRFPDVGMIVVSPLARGTLGYQGIAETDVMDVLADVKKRFPIDEDRVYLTGLSMGGGGALQFALTQPDLWAAVAVVCPSLPDGLEVLASNGSTLPWRLFHGALDPVVPVAVSRVWKERLSDAGARVEYIEYPKVRHNAWELAYKDAAIFEWFAKYRRNRFPESVTFTTDRYAYRRAYWIEVSRLTTGTLARVEAKFTGPNRLEIKTENLTALTLRLEGHPRYHLKRALRLVVDGSPLIQRAGQATLTLENRSRWTLASSAPPARKTPSSKRYAPDPSLEAPPLLKGPGLEGPVLSAFQGPHIYVYGTDGRPSVEELESRRSVAERAADWSTPLFRHLYSPRVAADRDLDEETIARHHLILFGNSETNALIRRFAAHLPLQLNPGAADYGLLAIAPKPGGGYLVVASGLPWWTGFEFNREGLAYLSPRYRLLTGFKDYVVFRGSQENIVAEGWFTPDWTLPAETRAVLERTGALLIQTPAPPVERPSIRLRP